jgi:cytochrome c oxidase assembly factor CtaG
MRRLRQTFDFCIAVLFVLVVTYALAVTIEKAADRAAARKVFDALVHDTCAHPVVGCRVTGLSNRLHAGFALGDSA